MIKVFLVDDDKWILSALKSIFNWEDYGFSIVGEDTDGLSAYEKIMKLKPDVVFADIVVPGLTGIELLARIKQDNIKCDVVILSSYADFSYAQQACRLQAFDYLLKPLEKEAILDTLERIRQKYQVLNNVEVVQSGSMVNLDEISNDTLKLIVRYIDENIGTNLRLYDVAKHFFFNASYISSIFKKELGISFSEYVLQSRLKIAQNLIKHTSLPFEEIYRKAGFDDYYYFNKFIKKYLGMSPKQLRLRQKEK